MREAVARIIAQFPQLSQEERAELAYDALLSLEPEDNGVEVAWEQELARRLASIKNGEAVAIPAEEVFGNSRQIT